MKKIMLTLVSVLLCACATSPTADIVQLAGAERQRLLSGEEILSREVTLAELPANDLLQISPAFKAYIDEHAVGSSPKFRYRALVRHMRRSNFRMAFTLDETTNTAQAFASRSGNCVSFSAMMVAAARYLGLDASFQQVSAPLEDRMLRRRGGGNTRTRVSHIAMRAEYPLGKKTIDFNFQQPPPGISLSELSDAQAFARYFNNRGMEALRNGDRKQAFLNVRKALEFDREASYLWNNLATIYKRAGELNLAHDGYSHAMALEPGDAIAGRNLQRLEKLMATTADTGQASSGSEV